MVQPAPEVWSKRGPRMTDGLSDIEMAPIRRFLCSRAKGRVLEVAAGSAKNLPFYSAEVVLTATDPERGQLELAEQRSRLLGRPVRVVPAHAEQLPFESHSFDTVVCTLGLCAVERPEEAIREMLRVVKPDGEILLLEHVRSTYPVLGVLQDWTNWLHKRVVGCDWNRRTLDLLAAEGVEVLERRNHVLGAVYSVVGKPPRRPATH